MHEAQLKAVEQAGITALMNELPDAVIIDGKLYRRTEAGVWTANKEKWVACTRGSSVSSQKGS